MPCIKQIKIKGVEVDSQLQPAILKLLKNRPHLVLDEAIDVLSEDLYTIDDLKEHHYEDVAGRMYNYFTDPQFIDEFGDWQNTDTSNTYDNGEPKLYYDKNLKKNYYRNKYNDKIFFPINDNGLESLYDVESINDIVKFIGHKFFQSNFNKDYNDLSFMADENIEESVRQILMSKVNQFNQEGELNDDEYQIEKADILRESLYYLPEWSDKLKNYFNSLGFKLSDVEDTEQVDNATATRESFRKASFEQDTKNAVSANMKAFLSFIPDPNVFNPVFEETGYAEFEDIYNTIQNGLADISPTIRDNNVEDTFEIMLDRVRELAHRKPYLKELVNILNHPSLSEERKAEFTQAFSLIKNPYFVTEIDFDKKGITYTNKDVSNVNANFNIIQREWGYNFEEKFLNKQVFDDYKLNDIINDIKSLNILINKTGRDIQSVEDLETTVNAVIDVLNDLGVETTERGFNSYLGNVADTNVDVQNLISKVKDTLKSLTNFTKGLKSKKFYYNDKYINPLNDESLFKDLAKEEAFFKPDGSDASIFSSGKSYWVYSLPSHIAGEVNKWKSNINELENLYNSEYGSGSKILQYLLARDKSYANESDRLAEAKNRIDNYKIGIFNALQNKKTNNQKSDPKGNTEVSKNDAIIDTINRSLLPKKGQKGLFNTPTPADKATSYLISHGYFVNTNVTSLDTDGRPNISQEVIDIFFDYFNAEYDRMYKAATVIKNPKAKKYVYYHASKSGKIYDNGVVVGNAFKSQLFEGLSFDKIGKTIPEIASDIYNEDGTASLPTLEPYIDPIKSYITKILKDSIKSRIDMFEANDIITIDPKNTNGYLAPGIDSDIVSAYKKDTDFPVHNAISDYHINTMINNYEYSKLFSGDPAFYKNMVDYAKRIPATYTDGMQLRLKNNDDLTFNAAIVAGVEVGSKYMDLLKELMGDVAEEYYGKGKINSTDAQAWITPKRWEFLVKRLGLWSKYHESALPKVLGTSKEPFTPKELKAVAQPLKGVYFKLNDGVPTYLKYSQAVLLPDVVKGTDMQRLYDKMVANDIDETITLDGIKVGAPIPDVIHTEEGMLADKFNLTALPLDNRGWKLQQNLPTKTFKDTDIGSQIQKNVLSGLAFNMDSDFNYGGKQAKGKDVYKDINSLIGALSDLGMKDLMREMDIDETGKINNLKGLYDLLLKEAEKRNINDNLINALRKEISIYGIPQSHSKLMNMFFAIVKDRLVKVKTHGGSYIQISNFGIDKLTPDQKQGIKWFIDPGKGLKPPRIEDGEVKPGQLLLSGSLIAKAIPNWKDLPADELKAKIDPKILNNVIGYRIPNQGLSSNDAFEIAGFLPEGMGDSVIAYGEIPTKTGSDFDIDKMFMMLPTFKTTNDGNLIYDNYNDAKPINEQTKGAIQNKLIEAYKSVFLHPEVVKDVMTPIDFEYIKTDITTIFKESKSKPDLYHFDNINQVNLKYDFLAGKAGVGQTANMLVDHVRGMFIQMSLIDTSFGRGHVNEAGNVLFDREYSERLKHDEVEYISKQLKIPENEVRSYKISHSISAFLNAFVDIAKDPYVTRGNWTTQTSNTGFMLLRAGVHPFIVNRFIGQPIIREYVDFVVNAESKFKNEKGDVRKLFLKNKGINPAKYKDNAILTNNLMWFDKQLKNNNGNVQASIIVEFFKLQDLSKNLLKSINGSKPDVSAAGKDLSSRFIIENSIRDIYDNEKNRKSGELSGFKDKLVDPITNESTILGHYITNSIEWVDNVIKNNPKIFIMGNTAVEDTFNALSMQLRGTRLTSQAIADEIYKNYYTFLMGSYEPLTSNNFVKELFIELPKDVTNAKLDNPDNFFLQQLELKNDNGIDFIRLQNKKRSKNIQNKLYRGWKMLMEDSPKLAENLIKYSFYSTGFQNSINEFFSHIPHEYFVENKLNQHIHELSKDIKGIQYDFIDQFYRHNHNNPLIVPNIINDDNTYTIIPDAVYKVKNIKENEMPFFAKIDNNLYELQGYDNNGNAVYSITYKLGFYTDSGSMLEYDYNNFVSKSKVKANNPAKINEADDYNNRLALPVQPGEYREYFKGEHPTAYNKLNKMEKEFNELFEETNDDLNDDDINDILDKFNDCE